MHEGRQEKDGCRGQEPVRHRVTPVFPSEQEARLEYSGRRDEDQGDCRHHRVHPDGPAATRKEGKARQERVQRVCGVHARDYTP